MTIYYDKANAFAPREALRKTFAQVLGDNAAGRSKTEDLLVALLGKFIVAEFPQDGYSVNVTRNADDSGWDVQGTTDDGHREVAVVTDDYWQGMNARVWQSELDHAAGVIAVELTVSEEITRKYALLDAAYDAWVASQQGEVSYRDWDALPPAERWGLVEKVDAEAHRKEHGAE